MPYRQVPVPGCVAGLGAQRSAVSNKDPRVHRGYAFSDHGQRCANGHALPRLGVMQVK